MTRNEAEHRIMDLLHEIESIRKEYAPGDDYITLTVNGGHYSFNNRYWEHLGDGDLDCWMDEGDDDLFSNFHPNIGEVDNDAED